ncbi:hypothetical protein R83H12_02554 [Fibrobacteria bacterium R8-3-H12]
MNALLDAVIEMCRRTKPALLSGTDKQHLDAILQKLMEERV